MSPSSDAPSSSSLSEVLSFTTGQIVQEIGYDDDVDLDLRDAIEDLIALVDTLRNIEPGAPVWVMIPKAGRPGHVMPGEIQECAGIAGLRVMSSVSLAPDWTGTRLASRSS